MKNGFTLIELIISIIVISICVIPIAVMYQQALQGSLETKVLTVATSLAEEKMEEILRLGYSGISNVGLNNFPKPFDDYNYEVIVHYVEASDLDTSVDPTETDYKNIEVQVTHAIQTVTLTSLLTDY